MSGESESESRTSGIRLEARVHNFTCNSCNHRFRGIHAKPNRVWHQIVALLTPSSERLTETFCIHCGGDIEGGGNWCPSAVTAVETCLWIDLHKLLASFHNIPSKR